MTRATLICGLTRALLRQVPIAHRREARIMLAALDDQYASLINDVERLAFEDGRKAGQQPDAETGYKDGWQRGYDDAVKDVMGRIGSPAITPSDDELIGVTTPDPATS